MFAWYIALRHTCCALVFMPECMPGYPCFMQYSSNMFVAAMLDDLSLGPWRGLSDEELATYLLKEQWGGLARHRRCIFWIFLLMRAGVDSFQETAWLSEGQLLRIREGDHQLLVHGTLIWEKMACNGSHGGFQMHVIFPPPLKSGTSVLPTGRDS